MKVEIIERAEFCACDARTLMHTRARGCGRDRMSFQLQTCSSRRCMYITFLLQQEYLRNPYLYSAFTRATKLKINASTCLLWHNFQEKEKRINILKSVLYIVSLEPVGSFKQVYIV